MFIGFPATLDERVALGSLASASKNDDFGDQRV